jgi:hypothetical protein
MAASGQSLPASWRHPAVLLRAGPVEFADQMLMGAGGRHADIVQQAQVEQEVRLLATALQHQCAIPGHDADPLAVGHIIDAHQIQRIGQRMDDFTQVDMNAAIAGRGRVGATWWSFARRKTWQPACRVFNLMQDCRA